MKANKTYAEALLQKQELNKVDGISGATLSYKQFFDAAQRCFGRSGQIIIVIGNV
ncbi:MAG: FMN-binding protein [Dialister invisus]